MAWKLTSDRPVYIQLAEEIEIRIIGGDYPPGEKLPSVRELAAEAVVNPNTMQKALAELERRGLAYTNRTAGRFVTSDSKLIQERQSELLKSETNGFLEKIKRLGVDKKDVASMILNLD